jgi:hypothetical protein
MKGEPMERKFSEIDWNQFTRMMVMETVSESAAGDMIALLRDHVVAIKARADFSAFVNAEILAEEDGRMIVFELTFSNRERLLECHRSREYRQLLTNIMHLLIGDPVIKMFRRFEGGR